MKKILYVMSLLIVASMVLAACGGGEPADAGKMPGGQKAEATMGAIYSETQTAAAPTETIIPVIPTQTPALIVPDLATGTALTVATQTLTIPTATPGNIVVIGNSLDFSNTNIPTDLQPFTPVQMFETRSNGITCVAVSAMNNNWHANCNWEASGLIHVQWLYQSVVQYEWDFTAETCYNGMMYHSEPSPNDTTMHVYETTTCTGG